MAQRTLLSIVQIILNSLNSDEVNSIDDTEESYQIALVAKEVYDDLISIRDWPHLRKVINLTASGSLSYPNYLSMPKNVQKVEWVKYDKREDVSAKKEYSTIKYLDAEEFLDLVMTRDSLATEVDTITDYDGTEMFIYNDRAPTYWTTIDNERLIFDAYDSGIDSTLQSSKSVALVYEEPTFTLSDEFVPDLPDKEFNTYLTELKAVVWNDIAREPNARAEQRARKAWIRSAQTKFRAAGGLKKSDFGRK